MIYNQRARALINLSRYNKELKNRSEKEQWSRLLYDEENHLFDHYESLSPPNITIGEHSVDELINHNFEVGRLRKIDELLTKSANFERLFYPLVVLICFLIVFIFIPVLLLGIIISGKFLFFILIPFSIIILLAIAFKKVYKDRILRKNSVFLVKMRTNLIESSKGEKLYESFNVSHSFKEKSTIDIQQNTASVQFASTALIVHYVYIFEAVTLAVIIFIGQFIFQNPTHFLANYAVGLIIF